MNDVERIRLRNVLVRSDQRVELHRTSVYKQIKVRLWGKGVEKRNEVHGYEMAGETRYVASARQFIVSRIDARNGAFGLIPESLDGAVVTADFPLFSVDETLLLPDYLSWLSRTDSFVKLCQAASEGTTNRIRLQDRRFLESEVPIPSILEQADTVAFLTSFEKRINEMRTLNTEARIECDQVKARVLRSTFTALAEHYEVEPLGAVCKTTSGGTPDRNRFDYFEGEIPWLKSGELEDSIITKSEEFVTAAALEHSSAKVFPAGTLLVAMYGATVGKTGVLAIDAATNQAVCAIFPSKKVLRDYVWWYLRCMRSEFIAASFGGAQPNISQRVIRLTPIPVPGTDIQKACVEYFDRFYSTVAVIERLQGEAIGELDELLKSVIERRMFREELSSCNP